MAANPLVMPTSLSLIALAALAPAAITAAAGRLDRQPLFWAVLALALAGLGLRIGALLSGPWPTGVSASLWVSVLGVLLVYTVCAVRSPIVRGLAPLTLPYLLALSLLALVWEHAPDRPVVGEGIDWLPLHIVVSVATYALITLAALAAFGAALQERALKARRPTPFTRRLPAVAECEAATVRFLAAGEIVLAMGIATGMALSYLETGRVLILDHKTILVFAAFALIGAVLAAHARSGLRGRAVVRAVMAAYLLMTLAYPGVKFVTDVLLGGG
jgi:ABC-type uncharacterized transport system permease subunit